MDEQYGFFVYFEEEDADSRLENSVIQNSMTFEQNPTTSQFTTDCYKFSRMFWKLTDNLWWISLLSIYVWNARKSPNGNNTTPIKKVVDSVV